MDSGSSTLAPTARSRRRTRRRWAGGLAAVALVATGLAAGAPASASHPEASLPGSNFELDVDANLKVDDAGSEDWATVTAVQRRDIASGRDDNSYAGGVKEDTVCPGETTGSIPNNKSDLLEFGVYEEEGSGTSAGFLHLYWLRVQEPSGTTLMDFEFNQSGVQCTGSPNNLRTVGDILVEYSIDQGGSQAAVTIRRWTGTAWGPAQPLASDAAGTINSSPISAADAVGLVSPDTVSPRTFGEASIDLDAIFDDTKCESFGSAMLKSRSSDSFTSQLKDFIAPVPITLTNCGTVIIRKQTDPDGATDTFGYTKTFGTDPTSENTFSLADGQSKTFAGVLFGSGYTVTEDSLPAGWDFVEVDCSASSGVTPAIDGAEVTFAIDDEDDVLDCTYLNRARGTIVVEKLTNGGAGAFEFTSGTLAPSPFTLTTTAAGDAGKDSETFDDLPPGTYDVAETVPAGWNLTSATCDDGSDPASIGLSASETVTCTFVNEPALGAILISKTRKHAASGPGDHPHAGVTFTVNDAGGAVVGGGTTDADGELCVGGLVLSGFVGDYTVTETLPTGYAADGDLTKSVSVTQEAGCGSGDEATVDFANTPLTDVTVTATSLVAGGTHSTISCVDGSGAVVEEDLTNVPDVTVTLAGQLPDTYVCTIVVDP